MNLAELQQQLQQQIQQLDDLRALDELRVSALGKKGQITQLMQQLGSLPADERREKGQEFNRLKDHITSLLDARQSELKHAALAKKLAEEKEDVTLPIRGAALGALHPISQTMAELITIFADMGFTIADGPDIEDDDHNFTALNIPPEHPARQMHDTFYLPAGNNGQVRLLRTHTSPVQIRTMRSQQPPIRVFIPGRTYRSDYDMTHTPMFHQCEALVIDEKTHMGHLHGTIAAFCRAFFELDQVPIRFRPSFFPFVEPGAEVDIGCSRKGGELKLGAGDDWLEIMGCGMVHPNVLRACNLDPDRYQGFALGMGIERIAMLKYGIPDLRTFFDSDLRWLRHYGFSVLQQPNRAFGGI